jgi:arylsulfatase A-like enzyme
MLPKRPFARFLIIGVAVLVLALVGVHAYNIVHLDPGAWRAAAEPLLARAREISERARPEYQDLALATLPPNPHNGPFYRLDETLHEAQVLEDPAGVAVAEGAVIYGFEFEDAAEPGLVPADGAAPVVEGGMLKVMGYNGEDHFTNDQRLSVPQAELGDIVIRARASEPTWMTLAWSKEEEARGDIWWNAIDVRLESDDEFHTYVINGRNALRRGLDPGDELARLFLRPARIAGTEVEIDFIRFLSKRNRYLAAINGVLYETLGGEMRKVLYMLPEQTLEWAIEVPQRAPTLEFGNGVLLDGHPVEFEVEIVAANESVALHSQNLDSTSGWQDFRFDLSPWAGKSVRLRLKVTGDARNVAFWSTPFIHSAPNKRFNAIIVLEDALRADYLSAHGYQLDTSPNKIALMSERGIQFDWAFSQATKTRPSVPALMTSLYPTATGVWHRSDALSERYLTLAEIMRAQGFVTASFIQNGNAGPYAGLHQGFDEIYDEQMMGQATEELLGERVFSWLGEHRDQNFFLYLHAIDPHGPYDPPAPFDQLYAETAGEGTPVRRKEFLDPASVDEPTLEGRQRRYAGEIRHNDDVLTGLLRKLDQLSLTQDTMVILLSDHGEYLGEHGHWDHHPPSLMPVIHVPLMMTHPSRFKQPKRIKDAVQLIDVMPTILELAEVDQTDLLMEGYSLVDLIEQQNTERWQNRVVIAEEPWAMYKENPCPCASMLHRNWQVISSTWLWPHYRRENILPHLHAFVNTRVYEYREDPKGENFALSFLPDLYVRWVVSDLISELQQANMTAWRKFTEGDGVDVRLDPDTLEHLRGLGYVN